LGARYARRMVGGGVVMIVLMLLILPVAVMLGGAIWSALMGFLLSENASDDAEAAGAS
jgi:Na+-transporting methylmalonyl-CoA/oxaloacetate decarboxylase gamma subunit